MPRMIEWQGDEDFLAIEGYESARQGKERRRLLKLLLNKLLPGRKKKCQLPLVTSLLSVVDHAIYHRQPLWPGRSVKGLRNLRSILDHAIFDTLGEHEPLTTGEKKMLKLYGKMLRKLATLDADRRVGVITTNYDISSDWAVLHAAIPSKQWGRWDVDSAEKVDFGTDWLDPYSGERERQLTRPRVTRFACYKLHGSTNWLRCPVCQRIYINPEATTWFQGLRRDSDDENTCHCSGAKLEPQIVSPSFVRQMDDLNLLNVWNQAQNLLREASHWVFVGYSMPEEDVAIRSMFTRALNFKKTKPTITIIQRSDEALPKYELLFGSDRLQFVTGGFGEFLRAW